jgi:peptidoglycan hydrolase CwlO-like protein
MGKPLNMDELTWLRQENKRLSEAQGKAAPHQQQHLQHLIDQLNKQIDDLSSQVEKLQEENNQLKQGQSPAPDQKPAAPRLMGSKDWFR